MTKKGKVLASTNDPLGNLVLITDNTLRHIKERRAAEGVVIELGQVQRTVTNAGIIRETTREFPAFGYSETDESGGLRVIVAFGTYNLFDGTATGYVSTAYPNDPAIRSAVGKIIWTAPATTDAAREQSNQIEGHGKLREDKQ